MPIYRIEASQSLKRRKRLEDASKFGVAESNKGVIRVPREEWGVVNTRFSTIDRHNLGKISEAINEFAVKYPKRKINVLDWGCGWGNSVKQLAELNPRVNSFGFTKDAYPENLNPGKGTIFNTSKTVFLRFLKRTGLKFDVIYSNLGLENLRDPVTYVIDISRFVNVGGKIFSGFSFAKGNYNFNDLLAAFSKANLIPEFVNGHLFYLTKVK